MFRTIGVDGTVLIQYGVDTVRYGIDTVRYGIDTVRCPVPRVDTVQCNESHI